MAETIKFALNEYSSYAIEQHNFGALVFLVDNFQRPATTESRPPFVGKGAIAHRKSDRRRCPSIDVVANLLIDGENANLPRYRRTQLENGSSCTGCKCVAREEFSMVDNH